MISFNVDPSKWTPRQYGPSSPIASRNDCANFKFGHTSVSFNHSVCTGAAPDARDRVAAPLKGHQPVRPHSTMIGKSEPRGLEVDEVHRAAKCVDLLAQRRADEHFIASRVLDLPPLPLGRRADCPVLRDRAPLRESPGAMRVLAPASTRQETNDLAPSPIRSRRARACAAGVRQGLPSTRQIHSGRSHRPHETRISRISTHAERLPRGRRTARRVAPRIVRTLPPHHLAAWLLPRRHLPP